MELPELLAIKSIAGCWVICIELPDWLAIKENSQMLSHSYGITGIYFTMKENRWMLSSSYGITGIIGY
jgi:hypothetical protein